MFQNFETASGSGTAEARLVALRARLSEAGVTGFLVPRADAHQGETVAPHDERLAWLTGFTGSAGVAVVLADKAALFVDGRYTVQARGQVDGAAFEIVPVHVTPPQEWLARELTGGERIGYDPWLHGRAEIARLGAAAEKKGAMLVSLPANPLDAAWEDQPPPPAGAVRVHPPELAGEDDASKRARIGEAVAETGCRAVVLTLPDSICWLLNIRGTDLARSPVAQGFAVLHDDGRVDLFMDPDKIGGDVREHLGNGVAVHVPDALPGIVGGLAGPVLLDETTCPLWFAERLEVAGTEIGWGRDPCVLPKARKNAAELDGMRAAHLRDGAVMARFLCWFDFALAAGERLTEIDIASRLEEMRAGTGKLSDISFDTIAGAGPNAALPHYRVTRASNRVLTPGDLMLVDSGAQYEDGTTDITRTMASGAVGGDERRQFTLVLKGMIAISRIRWPQGMRGRDLDPLARAALWRAGFDYDHGTGHGVGACLNVHEGPASISRRGEAVLEPGMILSDEPGYYREGAFGIRIENLLVVTGASMPEGGDRPMLGFETLTWCPIDRRLIEASLLDADERAWLDAYHAEVLARIGPLVDGEVSAWLGAACAPLGNG